VLKCDGPIDGLRVGASALKIVISSPQTKLDEVKSELAEMKTGLKKGGVEMTVEVTPEKPRGSKAIDGLQKTPDEFKAEMEAEVKKLGDEADKKVEAEKAKQKGQRRKKD
jgi:hypothetical protein